MMRYLILICLFLNLFQANAQAFNGNCLWGKCDYANHCMEGPSALGFHVSCQADFFRRNPGLLKRVLNGIAADAREARMEQERERQEQENRARISVQKSLEIHKNYFDALYSIYADPVKKRNYVIDFLVNNDIPFTLQNYLNFNDLNYFLSHFENQDNRPFYRGAGDDLENSTELPAEYKFLPQGGMPSIERDFSPLIDQHNSNLEGIKTVFNLNKKTAEYVLSKFELFKTLNIPLDVFYKVDSYENLKTLLSTTQHQELADFSDKDLSNINPNQNLIFLGEPLNFKFEQSHSIWPYFFGSDENYQSLSIDQRKTIASEIILNYTNSFKVDYAELPSEMKILLKFEDLILNQEGKYQSSGLKKLPFYWNYQTTLLRPINRFNLFGPFAMLYDYLLTDVENALKKGKQLNRASFHKIKLSENDYLENEKEYLKLLDINNDYIGLDETRNYLIFKKTQADYEGYIKRGLSLYEVIKEYNEKVRYGNNGMRINNGSDILKGQKELAEKVKLFKSVDDKFKPYIYKGKVDRTKNLLGFSAVSGDFITYWDFNSLSQEIKDDLLLPLETYDNVPSSFGQQVASLHNILPYAPLNAANTKKKPALQFRSKNPNTLGNLEKLNYERELEKKLQLSNFTEYLDLRNLDSEQYLQNGNAMYYFTENTRNLNDFITTFTSGNINSEIKANTKVLEGNSMEVYEKGFNLFIRTLIIDPKYSNLIKKYGLSIGKTKKSEQAVILTITPASFKNETVSSGTSEQSQEPFLSDLTFFTTVEFSKNKDQVIIYYDGDPTSYLSTIEKRLETQFGGDWKIDGSFNRKKIKYSKK